MTSKAIASIKNPKPAPKPPSSAREVLVKSKQPVTAAARLTGK